MFRILLVEDNPADAQMLRTALQKTGAPVEIILIDDGLKAMEYLNQGNAIGCDVVLLDLNLPRLGGFEVLQQIRQREDLKSLPVIIMSGSNNVEEIERCYHAGANSYICKPIHLDEILSSAARFVAYWTDCVQLPAKRRTGMAPVLRAITT